MQCRDRLNRVCATDGLYACLRESEVLHFALLNQLLHRSRGVFDRHVRIDSVLVEQVDDIGLETLERGLGDLLDVLGATVQPCLFAAVRIQFETELRCNHHMLTYGRESFAHEFLVGKRTINFSGVEERYAAFDGRPNEGDHLLLVRSRT